MATEKNTWINPAIRTLAGALALLLYNDIKSRLERIEDYMSHGAQTISANTSDIASMKMSIADLRADVSGLSIQYYQQFGLKGEGPDVPGNKRKN